MSGGVNVPYFPHPPAEYDQRNMSQLVQSFSLFARQVQNATSSLAMSAVLGPSTGIVVQIDVDAFTKRAIAASTGIAVTNGDGVAGNPTVALTGQALALHNLATSGIIARTGSGTVAARTLTGTTNQITVTNGDGVSGNPTFAAVVASQAEAQAGTDNTKLMTSLRVREAISATAAVYAQLLGVNSAWVSVASGTSILTSTNFSLTQYGGFTRSGGDITVPLTGHYRVSLKLYMGNSEGGRIEIHKNGTSQELLQYTTNGVINMTVEVSRIFQMTAGDTIACVGSSFEAPVSVYFGASHSNCIIQFIGT